MKRKVGPVLYCDVMTAMFNGIHSGAASKGKDVQISTDYPFDNVWDIERYIRKCAHERPVGSLACWNCWRWAIRDCGPDGVLIHVRLLHRGKNGGQTGSRRRGDAVRTSPAGTSSGGGAGRRKMAPQ